MASLDPARKKLWKAALAATEAPWIVCGLEPTKGAAALDGMPGLIDWRAHGQVSRLLRGGHLVGEPAVLPGDPARKQASVLLFPVESGAPALAKALRDLKVTDLALAESTFPGDFLSKLKQTFKKEGIRCTTLEP